MLSSARKNNYKVGFELLNYLFISLQLLKSFFFILCTTRHKNSFVNTFTIEIVSQVIDVLDSGWLVETVL